MREQELKESAAYPASLGEAVAALLKAHFQHEVALDRVQRGLSLPWRSVPQVVSLSEAQECVARGIPGEAPPSCCGTLRWP